MFVYKIRNKINNKLYIGQTIETIYKRFTRHKSVSNKCTALAAAIKKHGKENFEITVMSRANNIHQLNHREQYYISLFKTLSPNGYNLCSGGGNRIVHESTKIKISINNKGKKRSEECKKRLSESKKGNRPWNKGITHSAETRRKISELATGRPSSLKGKPSPLRGKILSPETKMKMSNSHKGRIFSDKHRQNLSKALSGKTSWCKGTRGICKPNITSFKSRSIICLNDKAVYDTVQKASDVYNCDPSSVVKVCKGKYSHTSGYYFAYVGTMCTQKEVI